MVWVKLRLNGFCNLINGQKRRKKDKDAIAESENSFLLADIHFTNANFSKRPTTDARYDLIYISLTNQKRVSSAQFNRS
jgi:hypothetical protein